MYIITSMYRKQLSFFMPWYSITVWTCQYENNSFQLNDLSSHFFKNLLFSEWLNFLHFFKNLRLIEWLILTVLYWYTFQWIHCRRMYWLQLTEVRMSDVKIEILILMKRILMYDQLRTEHALHYIKTFLVHSLLEEHERITWWRS